MTEIPLALNVSTISSVNFLTSDGQRTSPTFFCDHVLQT